MTTNATYDAVSALETVTELGMGFATGKIVLSAIELGLFTQLAEHPATAEELRERLGMAGRGFADFLKALVVLGLLERDGDVFRNSATAAACLVHGPDYQGGFLQGANFVLYPAWAHLTQALRTGEPQAEGDLGEMLQDPEAQRGYLEMQDALSRPLVPALAAAIDWTGFGSVTDVGGARGNTIGLLLHQYPHLTGNVMDQPSNAAPFEEHQRRLGTGDRATFRGGDFFSDPLPPADVVVISHVLADFDPDERRTLVRKAFEAVSPGGVLIVCDPMVDDADPELQSLLASLHMLVMTEGGSAYGPAECRSWMQDAGFGDVVHRPAGFGNTLVVGTKPN